MKWTELKLWRWLIDHRKILMVGGGIWLMLHVDPLGVEEATAERAESTVMRLSSFLYSGSGDVTVVLFDQDFLDADKKRSWPLPYGTQGLLLRKLFGTAAVRPARVFLDLLYKNPHAATSVSLAPKRSPAEAGARGDNPYNLLVPVQSMAPDVYLAGFPDQSNCDAEEDVRLDRTSIAEELHHHALVTSPRRPKDLVTERVAIVSWSGCENQYPMKLGSGSWALTPAFMLYHDDCVMRAQNAPCRRVLSAKAAPMTVRWGAFPPQAQAQYYKSGVCQRGASASASGFEHALQSFWGVLRQFAYRLVGADAAKSHDVDDRLPCPAFNVIPAQLLIQATDLTRFAAVLKGKTVLIGADIPGIPDTFVSPVHGTLPGVFLHAMALDNLLALQTRYLKEMSGWIWVAIEISLVMLAAFAGAWRLPRAAPKPAYQALRSFAFTLCWSALGALAHAIDPQWGFVRVAVGGLIATYFVREEVIKAVFILVLICLVALISVELGWAPKNWMALAIAAVTAFGIAAHVAKQPAHASTHANAGTDVQSLYSTRTHTFTVTEVSRKVLRVLSPSRRRSTS